MSSATAFAGIRARQWECLAQGSLRVSQQLRQLVEQLKFPLPDGTHSDEPDQRRPVILSSAPPARRKRREAAGDSGSVTFWASRATRSRPECSI
jgi:hypothetical protein